MPILRSLVLLLIGLLFLPSRQVAAAPPRVVELEGPRTVKGLLAEDLDGDGVLDLLVLEARALWVFPGRKGELPAPRARWKVDLAADVVFVDAAFPDGRGPAIWVLGAAGARRLRLETGAEEPREGTTDLVPFTDFEQANFADLARPDALLLPSATGWRWHGTVAGAEAAFDLRVPRDRVVEAPGTFLEDVAVVTVALPAVWLGARDEAEAPHAWALGGRALLGMHGEHIVAYPTAFLPPTGSRRLADLDRDQVPDVLHYDGTNQETTYTFFLTPPPRPAAVEGAAPEPGGDLRPPRAVLRIHGYCLPPDLVDLDADGLLDFVVTSIPIDARNTARALGGHVTASTRAFLQRPDGKLYGATPDASITSDIGVAIRFSQAGNIDIHRSFTILATGDYDGDDRRDLAIRTGPATLSIRRGVEGGVWEAEGRDVPIPSMGESPDVEGQPADLDGNGSDDLILLYRAPHEGRDVVRVLAP